MYIRTAKRSTTITAEVTTEVTLTIAYTYIPGDNDGEAEIQISSMQLYGMELERKTHRHYITEGMDSEEFDKLQDEILDHLWDEREWEYNR